MPWALMGVALAADVDVERLRTELEWDRADVAFVGAAELLRQGRNERELWRLYRDAALAGGLGAAARAELRAVAETHPEAAVALMGLPEEPMPGVADPAVLAVVEALSLLSRQPADAAAKLAAAQTSSARALRLEALRRAGDLAAAQTLARQCLKEGVAGAECLSGLWIGPTVETELARVREDALKLVDKSVKKPKDVAALYELRELVVEADDEARARAWTDAVAGLGEPRPLGRRPWTAAQIRLTARTLVGAGKTELPPLPAGERVLLGEAMARAWAEGGRHDLVAKMWEGFGEPKAAPVEALAARSLVHLGRSGEATEAAERAVTLAALPFFADLAGIDVETRRAWLGEAFVAMAEVQGNGGRADYALNSDALGAQILGKVQDPERRKKWMLLDQVRPLREKYGKGGKAPVEAAREAAAKALRAKDFVAVDQAVADGTTILGGSALGTDPAARPLWAELLKMSFTAAQAQGDDGRAAHLAGILSLLGAVEDPDLRWEAAFSQGATGQRWAAFASAAVAQAEGVPVPSGVLDNWWGGIGPSEVAASGFAVANVVVSRLPAVKRDQPAPPVGAMAPAFQVPDRRVTWTLDSARGRPVVLVFWASWCEPCHQELPALGALAPKLWKGGSKALFLGISIDEDQKAYQRALDGDVELGSVVAVRDPEVAKAFGIDRIPTIVLLDGEGKIAWKRSGWNAAVLADLEARLK